MLITNHSLLLLSVSRRRSPKTYWAAGKETRRRRTRKAQRRNWTRGGQTCWGSQTSNGSRNDAGAGTSKVTGARRATEARGTFKFLSILRTFTNACEWFVNFVMREMVRRQTKFVAPPKTKTTFIQKHKILLNVKSIQILVRCSLKLHTQGFQIHRNFFLFWI